MTFRKGQITGYVIVLDELSPAAAEADEHPKPAVLWTDARSNLFDALK
jgi:hypothetical protein